MKTKGSSVESSVRSFPVHLLVSCLTERWLGYYDSTGSEWLEMIVHVMGCKEDAPENIRSLRAMVGNGICAQIIRGIYPEFASEVLALKYLPTDYPSSKKLEDKLAKKYGRELKLPGGK